MLHHICRIGLISIIYFGIFIGNGDVFASVPPHPSIAKKIKDGTISVPYFLKNRKALLERGLNAPWASPEIRNRSLNSRSGIERSLGPSKAPSGSWRALVILVQFTDKTNTVAAGYFDNLIFGTSTGTVRDYYGEISYGTLDIVTVNMPSSIGWILAPQTYSYYVNDQNGFGDYPQNAQKLVEDVVTAADSIVDFSQYDNDLDGYVDALFIVHTGQGAEFTGDNHDIWSHAWVTSSPQLHDGVYVYRYSMEPEYWETSGDMTCGVFTHELGHAAFGLPDLYDRDYSSEGLGDWSLMAGGSWNGPTHRGNYPAFPDAWSHFQMGYVSPTNVVTPLFDQSINNAESAPEAYRLWTNGGIGNQYFLVQNRQLTGYDAYLPNSGLLIFHVDEAVSTDNDREWYPGYTSYGHYLVALEQADGLYDLENGNNRGNTGDPYPGSTLNYNFSSITTPNSNSYSGTSTNVSVKNISSSASVMMADLQVGIIPGKPLIIVNPDTINFGTVSIGYNRYDTVYVENGGAEPLIVSNVTSTLSEYTPSPTSFTVTAGNSQSVVITFAPTDTVAYNGTLTITNNDTAQATVQVALLGKGEYPPAITVTPDSFSVVLVQNDSTYRTLTIGNTGTGSLRWSISSEYVSIGSRVQESAASMKRHIIKRKDNAQNKSISGELALNNGQISEEAVKVYSKPGYAPSGGKDIAILGADAYDVSLPDIANYFISSGRFSSVTTINGFSITPTLVELQAYNAVVVFGWNYWADNIAIGNVLADYVDGSGNVLIAFAANATGNYWMVDGRFNSDNYWLIMPNAYSGGSAYTMGSILYPGHPIMSGISSVEVSAKLNSDAVLSSTAICLANFSDGTPLIAVDDSRPGKRVDLSFPVFSASVGRWGFDAASNADELIINATEWLSTGGNWLAFDPDSGSIVPSTTQDVTIKFNAKDLQGGDYRSIISIASNDPVNNPKNVPANLHVIGIPIISVVPDTLDVGTEFVGMNRVDSIKVRNIGSDILNVTNITSNLTVFTPNVTNFILSPGREQTVEISFAPIDTGSYVGILSITSNDSVHKTVEVLLMGRAAYVPVISVIPDSFTVELVQNDSTLTTMTIGNTGQGHLNWNINPEINDSITTTFIGGNGHKGNMFDITAINTVTIQGFDIHPDGNTDIEIYYKSGSFVGFQNNPGAWTFAASFSGIVAQHYGSATPLPHTLSITIPAGQTYAFYVTSSNSAIDLICTNGTAVGQVYASDENLQFKQGCGLGYPFTGYFSPRIWNGRIHYKTGAAKNFWSVTPLSGTVDPGSNQVVSVKFSAEGLNGGNYRSMIPVESNDPVTGLKNIPANLHVIGIPIISVAPDTIKYEPAYVGIDNVETLRVINLGSDLLVVDSITVSDTVFHLDKRAFTVMPGVQENVLVKFKPVASGIIAGSLSVYSNDSINSIVSVNISGYSILSLNLVSFVPLNNALNVSKDASVIAVFNQPIDPPTMNNSTIRINGSLSGLHSSTINYSSDTLTAIIDPITDFKVGETVSITLTRGIKSITGDSLISSYSWQFTVKTKATSGTFAWKSTVGVGNAPWFIAGGDFDKDGDIDLAVVNNYSNSVSILMNDGSGTFTASSISVGSYPGSIISGDFNSDGNMDLAVTNGGSYTVSILMNNGNGTFSQTSLSTGGVTPWELVAVDVEGDGDLDLAVINNGSDGYVILKNNGSGVFTLSSSGNVQDSPYSLTAADWNGDGKMDLAVANSGSNTVSILQNDGGGIFTLIDTIAVGSFPFSTTPMDVNGDGAIDLAVSNLNSKTISILTNDGSGTLTQTSTIAVGPQFKSATDIDGDGDLDLIVPYSDSITVFQNNGSGTFTKKSVLHTGSGSSTRMIIAADLNNDGTIDFAGVDRYGYSVSVYLNAGPTGVENTKSIIPMTFALRQNYPNPFNPSTTIKFDVPKSTHVTLSVYNILGALVTTLVDDECKAGSYSIRWNGQAKGGSVASGIYFTVIRAGDFRKTIKMLLMK
jgi:immune inhibitor A